MGKKKYSFYIEQYELFLHFCAIDRRERWPCFSDWKAVLKGKHDAKTRAHSRDYPGRWHIQPHERWAQ
jgi:hypothetical protein